MNSASRPTAGAVMRFALALSAACAGLGGCSRFLSPLMGEPPQVSGTWTGRLVSVAARSGDKTWDAAAIEIERGPEPPPIPIAEHLKPVPREVMMVALLLKTHLQPLRILDPRSLKAPIGSRVRVRGKMLWAGVTAPPSDQRQKVGYATDIEAEPIDQSGADLAILLDGEPQVLAE